MHLDPATVIKTANAIAAEIDLGSLLEKLVRVALEKTGARRGALLLEKGEEWAIEAMGEADRPAVDVLMGRAITANGEVSSAIVAQAARLRESIVLDNACQSGAFMNDPYIKNHKVKSVACMPLMNRERISGIIYLEDNRAARAFTDGSLELLHMLSTTMAIALDNARSYRKAREEIAQHRDKEAAIREEQEYINKVLETVAVPLIISRLSNGRILYGNPAFIKLSGLSRQEYTDFLTTEFYADQADRLTIVETLNKQGYISNFETRFLRGDGSSFWGLLSSRIVSHKGEVYAITTFIDITERKLVEDELKQIKYAIDSTTDAIGMATAQGRHFYQNKAFDRMFGFTVDEVALRHPIAAYKDKVIGQEVFEAIMSGNSWQGEVEMIAKDGNCLPIFLRADAVKDANGNVVSVIGVHTDISERKKAEKRLIRSEEKYRTLVDNMQDAVYRCDLEGNVTFATPSAARLLGYPLVDSLAGKSIGRDIYYHPDEREKLLSILEEKGTVSQYEAVLKKHDGSPVCVLTNSQYYRDENNSVIGIEGVFSDITERKRAEQEIEASLKRNQTLLRELYHRTKNNMQVISSMLSLQLEYVKTGKIEEIFNEMENRIQSMSLVHKKLYQSQNLSSIDMGEYVIDLVDMLIKSYGIPHDRIGLNFDISGVNVLIDTAVPCGLIINELISNALKYAFPDGRKGEITIRLHRIEDGGIELTVADNGAGVPPGFDFRANGRMGLNIVFALTEYQLKGRAEFMSVKGTECVIRFKDTLFKPRV
ncbi:MAG: PAS domain S-box protein [Spirochaetes bacterium]|nr:PAS domain S-box protein [Spirochaetota bacterium]